MQIFAQLSLSGSLYFLLRLADVQCKFRIANVADRAYSKFSVASFKGIIQ